MGKLLYKSDDLDLRKGFLGVELGSTRIKAILIDDTYVVIASGEYKWESKLIDGIWSYDLNEAVYGFKSAIKDLLGKLEEDISLESIGVSGMMHGYLAFDHNWNLLTPFRTWQNTMTRQASEILIEALQANVPQRWSVAHLLQAVLNKEAHVEQVAHLTTLAGYIHFLLTGENTVCIDEGSGMFIIDPEEKNYDRIQMEKTQKVLESYGFTGNLREILPSLHVAGRQSGSLSKAGAGLIDGLLPEGVPFAPPTGDGGTGMIATNTVAPKTGNLSAGTSIFADIVLEKPLKRLYPEIDIVATPSGKLVAEIHGNNCTNDMNLWVKLFEEILTMFGKQVDEGELFTKLYECSLQGSLDCDGITVINYMAGECITHLDEGRPMIVRNPNGAFNLSNFIRAHLYSLFATLKIGIDILKDEDVVIDSIMGHGGVFKTPGVAQRYLAAACNTPVVCMENAGEGGPYGMALLCAYMSQAEENESLEDFLQNRVFCNTKSTKIHPDPEETAGFEEYMQRFQISLQADSLLVEKGL